ncbi:TonB-dependent receptor [Adhaeribacter pallidiroseus]|uniref:TonB-dependent receptor n=1 Tax=Adhaeribacter pallidiroseus TaxID=2072847 RepID=A0A369QRK2_9BACT|nr:TonB-dependent receptor [Adhaeribacter pallidiroseus]RDC64818.1 hypothetical protein AHMF7616_03438 [Adhaeribacter pallidiroseus]
MIKKSLFQILFLLLVGSVYGQTTDSMRTHALAGVTITTYQEKPAQQTALLITTLALDSLSKFGNYNLTDLIARTPGVTMLSTGVAIAKPVIRGLYGNRVVVLLSGLKFDNQQWQEEHGLGLSDMGLQKVELVKGPLSVLYGTEAMGGVINLIEENAPANGIRESEVALRVNSNTGGGLLQGGYKVNNGDNWFRVRVGVENNADYQDGHHQRVLNSRFDGYYLKSTYGFRKKNWVSTNNLMSSFNRFGFIFNDVYTFIQPDKRWSRHLNENPAHLVLLNTISSDNDIFLNNSKLNVNVGVQSNKRLENEGGGAISLNMHLLTVQYLLKWEKELSAKTKLILSNLGSLEDNTNYGARKIVPDARMQESNVSGYLETNWHQKVIWENGLGVGQKYIKTYFTASVNGPDKEIHPFSKFSPYYNAFTGLSLLPTTNLHFKLNASTGVRIPNLAELSSDGLHEGVFTYEIGNPDLKNEQNLAFNGHAELNTQAVTFWVSPFYNHFFNFISLNPTTEEWFGFPVYRYQQQNVNQYGGEAALQIKASPKLSVGSTVSGMISKTKAGDYTPFIPATKITPNLHYTFELPQNRALQVFTTVDYNFKQSKVAPYEIATPAYNLWNAGFSTVISQQQGTWQFTLTGNNLLNRAYYDHLSRFKYFGLLNMGRNITFQLKYTLTNKLNKL